MLSIIKDLKNANQDFEFYPTTAEILRSLGNSILANETRRRFNDNYVALDIGAGNGKTLDYLKDLEGSYGKIFTKTYGIEKSQILINQWDKDHLILGVDFHKTTLLDKEINLIYVNPPYSEYSQWISKIISEAPASCSLYFLCPTRWKNDRAISEALDGRKHKLEIIGTFSFENAEDRTARANVDLVRVKMEDVYSDNDPFIKFFDENFVYPEKQEFTPFEEEVESAKLVTGQNLVDILVDIHDREMEKLIKNFSAICELDADLLKEFEITKGGLVESLKQKISTLKKRYWKRLFDGMQKIRERLTKSSRDKIMNKMQANTCMDFNHENAYSVVIWIMRHCNEYFDSQFIETYQKMINFANIEGYKSNQRVFRENDFRYRYGVDDEDGISHYKLKVGHRIVLENCGGLYRNPYFDRDDGLSERLAEFLSDLMTIANNMEWTPLRKYPSAGEWKSSEEQEFKCLHKGEEKVLFRVKAFLNGNCHIKFNQDFVLAMNVKFGALNGWISSSGEASAEMDIEEKEAAEYFALDFSIGSSQLMLS